MHSQAITLSNYLLMLYSVLMESLDHFLCQFLGIKIFLIIEDEEYIILFIAIQIFIVLFQIEIAR